MKAPSSRTASQATFLALRVQSLDLGELLAGFIHHQFDQGVAGTVVGGRAEDHDVFLGQAGINVRPLLIGIRHQLAADRNGLGDGLEDLVAGQGELGLADLALAMTMPS